MKSTYEPVAGILRALHDAATTTLILSNAVLATNRETVAIRNAKACTGKVILETNWESDSQAVATAELPSTETRELMP